MCVCVFFLHSSLCKQSPPPLCVFYYYSNCTHQPTTTINHYIFFFRYTLINWKWMKPNTPTNFSWPGHKTNNTYMYTRVCADRNKKIISVIDDARCCLFVFFLFTPTLYSYLEIWHLKPGFFQVWTKRKREKENLINKNKYYKFNLSKTNQSTATTTTTSINWIKI